MSSLVQMTTMPTYGAVTHYKTMPKNRNDMFDCAAFGAFSLILPSLALMFYGLGLTAAASPVEAAQFPALPVDFVSSNLVVKNIVASIVPIAEGTGTLHLHYLVSVG